MIVNDADGISLGDQGYKLDTPFPPLPGADLLSRTWMTPTILVDDLNREGTAFLEHWVGADGRLYSDFCCDYHHDPQRSVRGYRANWELRNGKLYLRNLQGRFRLAVAGPVVADWFSGYLLFQIRIERKPKDKFYDEVTSSVYRITIDKGIEIDRQKIDTVTSESNSAGFLRNRKSS